MRSKFYRAIKEKAPVEAVDLDVAVAFIRENARKNFNETVEVHIRLGVNSKKSDQMVRGTVDLPAGPSKQQQVVVFTADAKQQKEALSAGAFKTGGEELVDTIIKESKLAADVTIATPAMMPKVAQAAKILGPKGLMPNPKTGTVSDDPVAVVKQIFSGKVSFKMDQQGNVHLPVAKINWESDKIIKNTQSFLAALKNARPPAAKGEFFKSVTIKTTMGPGIRVSA